MNPSNETYSVGDQPGKGVYACEECGTHVTLRADSDALPACSICEDDADVHYLRIS